MQKLGIYSFSFTSIYHIEMTTNSNNVNKHSIRPVINIYDIKYIKPISPIDEIVPTELLTLLDKYNFLFDKYDLCAFVSRECIKISNYI
jgi:hypothetical protein